MPRPLFAAALAIACVLALAAPAQAAKPALSLKAPAGGDMTLAHVVLSTKGGKGTPKLVLTNRTKLGSRLTIAGGVKKLKKNSYLASIAVLLQTGGGGGAPAFKFTLPKGMTFSKFSSKVIAKNLLGTSGAPKFCAAIPPSFGYVAKKLLAGSPVPRFPSAAEYVAAGYQLNCPGGYDERANLAAALRGEPDPGAGGAAGGADGGGEGGGDEEDGEGGGTAYSSTLRGEGTVTAEGGGVFRYEIKFNEPVYGFMLDGAGSVRCPTEYGEWKAAECDPMGDSQTARAGDQSLPCQSGELTSQFSCMTPSSAGHTKPPPPRPTVPAGTFIVGRFKTHPGTSPQSGKIRLTGYGPNGQSTGDSLSGP